jgi:predicted transcriptional regulator
LARFFYNKERNKSYLFIQKITIMKQLFTIIGITALMASCKTKTADDTQVLSASKDAADYTEFVKWKAAKDAKEKEKTVVVYRTAPARTVTKSSNETVATTPAKKGWSKAAKGAAIGAGAGAVAGAIINKRNRAVGAVIGGVAGAGVGYGIGRAKDKKDGRY